VLERSSSGSSRQRAVDGRRVVSTQGVLRFGLGVALLLAARAVTYGIDIRFLPALDYTAVAALAAGLLYGWPGIGGAVVAGLVATVIHNGRVPDLRFLVADGVVGLAAFEVFRRLRGVGRRLPNLKSWIALLLVALVFGLPSALLMASAMGGVVGATGAGHWVAVVGTWWATTITSIMLLAPPLLLALLAIPFTAAARAPIRGEVEAGPLCWLRSCEGHTNLRHWLAAAGPWVLALALWATLAGSAPTASAGQWIALVYAIPVLWAATEYGLRGGVLAASLVGCFQLLQQPFEPAHIPQTHEAWLSLQAGALIFCALGALWGGARQREAALRTQLAEINSRLRHELKRTIQALQSAIAAKDAYTEGHLRRVSIYATEVGRSLGVSGRELEQLELASLLHDVGKIGIPEEILHKPGGLDPEEFRRMRDHPEIGARILEDVEGLAEVAPLVRYHQERWDGDGECDFPGYPHGLAGEEIPLGARIIAVVDAYDAMTSDRPYRAARPSIAAIAELSRERGRQFDPAVVDAFLFLLEQRPWRDDSRM
jgi:HD domain